MPLNVTGLTTVAPGDRLNSPSHAAQHNAVKSILEQASTVIAALEAADAALTAADLTFSKTDGSRPFTNVVGGVDPTAPAHLATANYVTTSIAPYVKQDGSTPFTAVQSGVDPTAAAHLTTKGYTDTADAVLQAQIDSLATVGGIWTTVNVPWSNAQTDAGGGRTLTGGGIGVLYTVYTPTAILNPTVEVGITALPATTFAGVGTLDHSTLGPIPLIWYQNKWCYISGSGSGGGSPTYADLMSGSLGAGSLSYVTLTWDTVGTDTLSLAVFFEG